jgi:hypothetical protein
VTTAPHRPSPARRRIAAAGAAAVATGAVLPLTAPVGATPAPPVAVGHTSLTVPKRAPAAPRDDPGCSTHDGVMVRSADMVDALLGRKGVTILWYSPSTRCTWASAMYTFGFGRQEWVQADIYRNDGRHQSASSPGKKAVTPAWDDRAPLESAAVGSMRLHFSEPGEMDPYEPGSWYNYSAKTGWY